MCQRRLLLWAGEYPQARASKTTMGRQRSHGLHAILLRLPNRCQEVSVAVGVRRGRSQRMSLDAATAADAPCRAADKVRDLCNIYLAMRVFLARSYMPPPSSRRPPGSLRLHLISRLAAPVAVCRYLKVFPFLIQRPLRLICSCTVKSTVYEPERIRRSTSCVHDAFCDRGGRRHAHSTHWGHSQRPSRGGLVRAA